MDESDIQVLIDGTVGYFHGLVDKTTEVGAPYLMERSDPMISDYTGIIDISGARAGLIYFTAPSAMLRHVLLANGEAQASTELMADIVGEVANTISGNARRHFGREFEISTPKVHRGPMFRQTLELAERSFLIPITWRQYRAALVVSLRD